MGKVCRIKQSTKSYKKRRGFTTKKVEDVLNTFNAEDVVNSSVNNESTLENNTVNSNASSPENASSSSFNLSNISTASSRKVKPIGYSTPSSSQSITGYRIIDVEILNIDFSVFSCPSCGQQNLKLFENHTKKKGLSSFLYVQCQACSFFREFYTSLASEHCSYDINKRIVYAMRACCQGHINDDREDSRC